MIPGFEDSVNKLVCYQKNLLLLQLQLENILHVSNMQLTVLEKGENLPHSGDLCWLPFFLSKGQSVQQIAPLFKNAPDYNERVTLYQLNHLAGTLEVELNILVLLVKN